MNELVPCRAGIGDDLRRNGGRPTEHRVHFAFERERDAALLAFFVALVPSSASGAVEADRVEAAIGGGPQHRLPDRLAVGEPDQIAVDQPRTLPCVEAFEVIRISFDESADSQDDGLTSRARPRQSERVNEQEVRYICRLH